MISNWYLKLKQRFYIRLNRWFFKRKNIFLGERAIIYDKVYLKINKEACVHVGHDFTLTSGAGHNVISRNLYASIRVNAGAKLEIGSNVGISSCCINCYQGITIGNNVRIGADCLITDSDSHSLDYLERRTLETDLANTKNKDICIEDDVLVGAKVIILKGVRIGARTVIGAGSVVTKSIPSDCIAAGNPCRVIKVNKVD